MKKAIQKLMAVVVAMSSCQLALAEAAAESIDNDGRARQFLQRFALKQKIRELEDEREVLAEEQSRLIVRMGIFEDIKEESLVGRFYELDSDILKYTGLAVETTALFTAGVMLSKFFYLAYISAERRGALGLAEAFLSVTSFLVGAFASFGNVAVVLDDDHPHNGFIYDYFLAEGQQIVKKLQAMTTEEAVAWYQETADELAATNAEFERVSLELKKLSAEPASPEGSTNPIKALD